MHELSVAKEIIDIVLKHCDSPDDLKSIELDIGALSGVYQSSLSFYIDLILTEKQISNVKVSYNFIPISYKCSCGNVYTSDDITGLCPVCSSIDREIIKGKDCLIRTIEVKGD